jgi:two-component system, OmpR family, phosphate regulon sensor histidine kinase PhoR
MKGTAFPWRLFKWFVGRQIFLGAIALAIFFALNWIWIQRQAEVPNEMRPALTWLAFWGLTGSLTVFAVVSVIMARHFVVPLKRLIEKTERIHASPFTEDAIEEAEDKPDEPGEWYELERALDQIGRDLQAKTIRLSREKTELRAIVSAVNEGIIAVNHLRQPLFFNSQFAIEFGLEGRTPEGLALGEILRSPDILNAFDQGLAAGESSHVQVSLETRNRGERSFQVSVTPLKKRHNQEIYGAVAVFYDVTERKRAEQMRNEFVGNVSHELRTPLTSIKGYLQTVMGDLGRGESKQALEFLGVVDRNVDRLMHLVDDLLDLSALQAGVALKRTVVDLQGVTDTVLGQIDHRDHEIVKTFAAKSLLADEHRLEQVLRNLLQNAIRYVPTRGKIEVAWSSLGKNGARLSVRDNGPGIEKSHQQRLFERFYRVDDARSRHVGGSGIGLALVKHIMQRHGGEVRVISEPGRGSEFICDFPG